MALLALYGLASRLALVFERELHTRNLGWSSAFSSHWANEAAYSYLDTDVLAQKHAKSYRLLSIDRYPCADHAPIVFLVPKRQSASVPPILWRCCMPMTDAVHTALSMSRSRPVNLDQRFSKQRELDFVHTVQSMGHVDRVSAMHSARLSLPCHTANKSRSQHTFSYVHIPAQAHFGSSPAPHTPQPPAPFDDLRQPSRISTSLLPSHRSKEI